MHLILWHTLVQSMKTVFMRDEVAGLWQNEQLAQWQFLGQAGTRTLPSSTHWGQTACNFALVGPVHTFEGFRFGKSTPWSWGRKQTWCHCYRSRETLEEKLHCKRTGLYQLVGSVAPPTVKCSRYTFRGTLLRCHTDSAHPPNGAGQLQSPFLESPESRSVRALDSSWVTVRRSDIEQLLAPLRLWIAPVLCRRQCMLMVTNSSSSCAPVISFWCRWTRMQWSQGHTGRGW